MNLTDQTITLYSFYYTTTHSTNLFLNSSVDMKTFKSIAPQTIYIPGKSARGINVTAKVILLLINKN